MLKEKEYNELQRKQENLKIEHKDLLERGEKAESKAGLISLVLSWLLGLILNILKVINFGWNFYSSEHKIIVFLLETFIIFILSWIVLYIIIKPFDSLYRNKYKKCITPEEFVAYKKISNDLLHINSEMGKIKKENRKFEKECDDNSYTSDSDGVSDFLKIAHEWSKKH